MGDINIRVVKEEQGEHKILEAEINVNEDRLIYMGNQFHYKNCKHYLSISEDS